MKRKISSDLTIVFQFAILAEVFTLSIIMILSLFFNDIILTIISLSVFLISVLIVRKMGVTKLKTVYKDDNSIIVRKGNLLKTIPFSEVQKIEQTFLFHDFPFLVKYGRNEQSEKLYFLPKGNFFKDLVSGENGIIEELRNEIRKTKANNGYN